MSNKMVPLKCWQTIHQQKILTEISSVDLFMTSTERLQMPEPEYSNASDKNRYRTHQITAALFAAATASPVRLSVTRRGQSCAREPIL
jgi:hypothetical protein